MERINPNSFYGPRAYFTDFDYKIVRYKDNKEEFKREVERRLKIMLLTKNTVVCAASHLVNKFSYNIFKENPILLNENMIIPALRRDKEHIIDYLEEMDFNQSLLGQNIVSKSNIKENMTAFYKDNVNKVVEWELMENTKWFRKAILNALKNDCSVIRRNIPKISKSKINYLIIKIEEYEDLTREILLEGILTWPKKEKRIFLNYVNLLYHMSGARVVNCESALPQENYVDYSLADFSEHRVTLSDTQVFIKIFFELAFEILCKNALSVEVLDQLSFEDINYIRKPIGESLFRKKYDEVIQKSLQLIRKSEGNPDMIVNDIEKPVETLKQISRTFEEVFKQEKVEYFKKKNKEITKELRKSTLALGINVIGFIPLVGSIANVLGLLKSSHETFINLDQTLRDKRAIENYDLYLKYKGEMLHKMIEKQPISEKAVLLDTLELLVNTVSERIII